MRLRMHAATLVAILLLTPGGGVFAQAPAASPQAPEGWKALKINDSKKPTVYRALVEDGLPVLHARAEGSASGAYRVADFKLAERPVMRWRWKVSRLIPGADNSKGAKEDSPVRIVLAFEGDKGKLSVGEQAKMRMARRLSGQDLPYATLMYVWSNTAPVGSVIPNPHMGRIQMVVASSGEAGVGAWQALSRDVAEDFRRAFKEAPGRLLGYGVMSDTDNTGETVEAWYGEISFAAKP
jgi:hypothetical protein